MLYTEHPFLDRFAAAAADGFRAVEYLGPYDHPPEEVAQALDRAGLEQALFNLPSGDWAGGERGLGGLPGREEEFEDWVSGILGALLAIPVLAFGVAFLRALRNPESPGVDVLESDEPDPLPPAPATA